MVTQSVGMWVPNEKDYGVGVGIGIDPDPDSDPDAERSKLRGYHLS
jgi:hypothetical protein